MNQGVIAPRLLVEVGWRNKKHEEHHAHVTLMHYPPSRDEWENAVWCKRSLLSVLEWPFSFDAIPSSILTCAARHWLPTSDHRYVVGDLVCHLRAAPSSSNDGMIHRVSLAPLSYSMVNHRAFSYLLPRPARVWPVTRDSYRAASLCAVLFLLFIS